MTTFRGSLDADRAKPDAVTGVSFEAFSSLLGDFVLPGLAGKNDHLELGGPYGPYSSENGRISAEPDTAALI